MEEDDNAAKHWTASQSNIETLLKDIKGEREEAGRRDNIKIALEIFTVLLLVATVVLTGMTYGVFYRQLKASERGIAVAHSDANSALTSAHRDASDALTDANLAASNALREQQQASAQSLQRADIANANGKGAAETQAGLTRTSNAINKQAFTAVQRAFITVDEIRVETFVDTTRQPVGYLLTPIIENSGQTPAVIDSLLEIGPNTEGFLWHIGVSPKTDGDVPPDPDKILSLLIAGKDPFPVRNIYLGPHAAVPQADGAGAESFTVKDFDQVFTSQRGHFFFGVIRYTDVFKAAHITKYCFALNNLIINGLGQRTPPTPIRCDHWNCVDDQCEADQRSYVAELAAAKQPEPVLGRPITTQ